jgi:hypothetical protein
MISSDIAHAEILMDTMAKSLPQPIFTREGFCGIAVLRHVLKNGF